ncbi:MAG: hypothetical protein WDN04_10215 [Rhodospirillales bacterium]
MASVVPILDVPKLLESARFVALGRATSVGGQACIKVSFVVKPEENTPTGCLPLARLSDTVGTQGKFGFFFLKRGDGVGLAAVSEDHPFVVAAPPEYNRFPSADRPAARDRRFRRVGLHDPDRCRRGPAHRTGPDWHGWFRRRHLTVPRPQTFSTWRPASRTRVAEEVYTMPSTHCVRFHTRSGGRSLRSSSRTGSPSIGRAWATASMLQAGDYSDIQVDLPFLLHPPGDAVLTESLLSLSGRTGGVTRYRDPPDRYCCA